MGTEGRRYCEGGNDGEILERKEWNDGSRGLDRMEEEQGRRDTIKGAMERLERGGREEGKGERVGELLSPDITASVSEKREGSDNLAVLSHLFLFPLLFFLT